MSGVDFNAYLRAQQSKDDQKAATSQQVESIVTITDQLAIQTLAQQNQSPTALSLEPEKKLHVKMSKDEARKELTRLIKGFYNLDKEVDLLTLKVSQEDWVAILNSKEVDHWLLVLSKAEIPDNWMISLAESFSTHKEFHHLLLQFLALLVESYGSVTVLCQNLNIDKSFYESLLESPFLERLLLRVEDSSLFRHLLILPKGPTVLSKIKRKFDCEFTIPLQKTLSIHPQLFYLLPIIYTKEEIQSFHSGREVHRHYFLEILKLYPNLPYPNFSYFPEKLKEHLNEHYSPFLAWHFKLFEYSALNSLPSEIKLSLIDRLMKDQDPVCKSILFSWALSGRNLLYSDRNVTVFEEIYNRFSSDDKTQLIEKTLNESRNAYTVLYDSNFEIAKLFAFHLLLNKPKMFYLFSVLCSGEPENLLIHSHTLDNLFKSFEKKDWEEFAKARYEKLWVYIFIYLPEVAQQNYPEARNFITENNVFYSIFNGEPNEKLTIALQVFLSLLPREKALSYQEVLNLFKDPVTVLRNCGSKEELLIRKAHELFLPLSKIAKELGLKKEWKLLNFVYSTQRIHLSDDLKQKIRSLYLAEKRDPNEFPHLKKALCIMG